LGKDVIIIRHLGDITKINGAEIEPVDVVTAGSPCQDLSVAGKRAGLEGERSGLFMEQIRIIKEMRENDRRNNGRTDEFIRPRYMVWENVPGALSSNKGEDFRCVLEETAKIVQEDAVIPGPPKGGWSYSGCILGDGWPIAWRIHDAQFWGVPQRRKRIALVADFGGGSAPEILFVRKGLSRDTEPSKPEREGTSADTERGF
jgi:DNA (cytosine-5)-methyltransferase 1